MLLSDLRLAVRTLRRTPRFALLAIALLALGIGADATLFSVADAVLFRPFPFVDEQRLVIAGEDVIDPRSEITYNDFLDWRAQTRSFDEAAAIGSSNWTWHLRTATDLVTVRYRATTGNFFSLLGARALIGRTFTPDDDRPGSSRTVVISDGFWQRHFGGDRGLIGHAITLDEVPFTVIGVMPANFQYPAAPDAWTPLVPDLTAIAASIPNAPLKAEEIGVLFMLGRMKPGVALETARVDLNRVIAQETRAKGRQRHVEARIRPLVDDIVGSARAGMWALLAAVTVLLLVACANVAGLMLVRASSRSRELAVRLALGASNAALVRQLACETAVLAALATMAGLAIARAGLPVVVALLPPDLPRLADAAVDGRVLAFTILTGAATAILSSIAPALKLQRGELEPVLRRTGTAVVSTGLRQPLRRALIAGELAAAVVLLSATGLLARSVAKLERVDLGFTPDRLLAVRPSLPSPTMSPADARAFFERATREVAAMSGVQSVAGIWLRPLSGPIGMDSPFRLEGQSEPAADNPYVNVETITSNYFEVMQARVLDGRPFTDDDRATTDPVVIVSQSFARRMWPGQPAIGKQIQAAALDYAAPARPVFRTVVGVVSDMRYRGLEMPTPTLYAPLAQSPDRIDDLMIRTSAAGTALAPAIRQRLEALNGNGAVRIDAMTDVVSALEAPWRSNLALFVAFAVVTVILAATGLYAMLAYAVVEHAREIGVRLVLGATPRRIATDVIASGGRVIAVGAVSGLAIAAAAGRLVAALLFEVSPLDPMTLAAAPLGLAVVAIVACAVPAIRASRTDPAVCLRAE